MKDMREFSELLDETIEKGRAAEERDRQRIRDRRTELRKALSDHPHHPITVGPDSGFYSPYRHTSFGWMPHDPEHWREQGIGSRKTSSSEECQFVHDGYREVRQYLSGVMKSVIAETVEKARKVGTVPNGTIHDYKGHKYEKKGPGDWRLVHEGKASDHPIEQHHTARRQKVQDTLKDRKNGLAQEPSFDDRARAANEKAREIQQRETEVQARGLEAREADLERRENALAQTKEDGSADAPGSDVGPEEGRESDAGTGQKNEGGGSKPEDKVLKPGSDDGGDDKKPKEKK